MWEGRRWMRNLCIPLDCNEPKLLFKKKLGEKIFSTESCYVSETNLPIIKSSQTTMLLRSTWCWSDHISRPQIHKQGQSTLPRKGRGWLVARLLSRVRPFISAWTAAHQASLSFTTSRSLLKLMFTESVMPSNHITLCHPLLPSIFPSIRVWLGEGQ